MAENKSIFKTTFCDPFQNQRPDLKVSGERPWLRISKWCDTSQLVQRVGCMRSMKCNGKF